MNTCTRTGLLPVLVIAAVVATVVDSTRAQASGSLTLIPNPTPDVGDLFGFRLALVGTDAVLIGAPGDDTAATNGGIAYLYSLDGTRRQTFFSPNPRENENFGILVEAVGNDRVLITAIQDGETMAPNLPGAAYLFGIDGTLLETFLNPSPSVGDGFGVAAALPDGTLIVGSFGDDADAENAGRAYQYQPGGNGAPLQTFSDPTPEVNGGFGFPVTALGTDRFSVGVEGANSKAGEVHVFNHVTGGHVTTLTHPDQTLNFVDSTAALGSDVVVVGTEDFTVNGELGAGGVFLFDAGNGALLLTIPNPAPEFDDAFGIFVETIGSDRIIIGADLDNPSGINDAGTVYVYDSSGNLLDTIDNPTPVANDQFGFSLSGDTAGVLAIGSPQGEFDFAAGPGQVYIATGLSAATPATLIDVTRTLGIYVSGGVPELLASDDTYYVLQSGPGFDPSEPHPARADFTFDSAGFAASTLDITLEEKANIGGPTAVVLIRDRVNAEWDELDRFSLSPTDQTFEMTGIPAAEYIGGGGNIKVRVRTFAILILNPAIRGIFSHDFVGVSMRE